MIVLVDSWAAAALVISLDHSMTSLMTFFLSWALSGARNLFVSMVSDVFEGKEAMKACRNQSDFLAESLVSRTRFASSS